MVSAPGREAPTPASNGVCKVDPLEHQPELGRVDLDVRAPLGDVVREVKTASGELFITPPELRALRPQMGVLCA
jgi:hypothetical protein